MNSIVEQFYIIESPSEKMDALRLDDITALVIRAERIEVWPSMASAFVTGDTGPIFEFDMSSIQPHRDSFGRIERPRSLVYETPSNRYGGAIAIFPQPLGVHWNDVATDAYCGQPVFCLFLYNGAVLSLNYREIALWEDEASLLKAATLSSSWQEALKSAHTVYKR